jgi:prepilin-type processing-associated H-X9-DG protein
MAKLPGESIVTTFIGGQPARDILARMLVDDTYSPFHEFKENWAKVLQAAGLDDARSFVEKTVVADGHFITRSLVRTTTPPHGLMTLLKSPAVDDATLAAVPPDAYAVAAWRLDLSKLYEQVKTAAQLIDPEKADRTFELIEEDVKKMGLPLQDILDPIGDQWVIYNAPSTGGFILTGWTLVGTVDDPRRFGRSLDIIGKMISEDLSGSRGGAIREFDSDGVTVHYIDAAGGVPFSGSWAVAGDKFIVALYPQLVEDAIRQLKQKENILQDARFTTARARAAQEGGPLVYISNPQVVRDIYPLALVIVSAFRAFDQSMVPGDLLPSMQRLLTYVGGDAMSVHVTDDGVWRTQSIDNPLLSPLTITAPGLWASVILPAMLQEDHSADQARSASNLHQIGQGLLLYSNENKGNYPPDFKTLLATQDLTVDVLHSPYSEDPAGEDMVYLHYDGMDTNISPEIVVAYDGAALLSEDATNILYGDGHVDWQNLEGFRQALETSRKADPRSAMIAPGSPAARMLGDVP